MGDFIISATTVTNARQAGSALPGMFRTASRGLALSLGLALAACQSAGVDALEGVAAGPRQAAETIGAGETAVALLLPRSAGGAAAGRARDIREGAALALEDLGAGKIALTVHDTGAGAGGIAALAEQVSGARIILGPADAGQIAALAALSPRPPALAFGGNGAPHGGGIFAMETDAVDSALEAARIAAGAGRKIFVVVAPQGFVDADAQRLARGLQAAGASLAGTVRYGGASLAADIAAQRDMLVKADGVIVFGEGNAPTTVAAALRRAASLGPKAVLIGNLSWAAENFARPELDGALVAMPEQAGLALVADRYRARTGRALTPQAAYGYDAVAVTAGIVRAMGAAALTPATLTKPSGFRGATGIFRFHADGTVERPLALYQVRDKALQLIDAAPEGF